ncbi:MAG: peptide deformylase [Bacteroidota bacterium]
MTGLVATNYQPSIAQTKGFSQEQIDYISSGRSEEPMRVFKIDNPQDSILLRTKSQDIKADPNDEVLELLIDRMYATVNDSASLGAGIAAPQVGVLKNVIWVQRFDKEGFPFEAYINPRILQYSEMKWPCREGCLSIPDRRDTTNTRAYAIMVEYDRSDGSHHIEMVEEFTSVIFQHEIDHLNGILYLDHLQQEITETTSMVSRSSPHDDLSDRELILLARESSNAAYKGQDINAIAKPYSSKIIITGGDGSQLSGSKKIQKILKGLFEKNPGLHYVRTTSSLRVSEVADRAWEQGTWQEVPGTRGGDYSAHWIKEEGQWKLLSQIFVTLH